MESSAEIARLKAENAHLRQQNEYLLEQLRLARQHRFGTSSEKSKANGVEQLSLFQKSEYQAVTPTIEPEWKEIKGYKRRRAGNVGISRLPPDLPVEVVEHELPPEERYCPECGGPLHTMGREIREELKLIPAHGVIVRHIRYAYACRNCERHSDHVPVKKANMPNPVIKGSFASPEAIAHIAYEKFVMGSPLYRQEQDWAHKGIPLSRQLMGNWLIRATQEHLFPIYDALKGQLLKQDVLHADETSVQVLREPSKAPQSKSYMWLYRTGADAADAIILYDYKEGRHKRHPQAFLEGYQGFLHTDGYEVYHDLPPEIKVVGCWAHARRRFDEACKTIPISAREHSPAKEALRRIGQLYQLEAELEKQPCGFSFAERHRMRQERSKPLLDAFFIWCSEQQALPKSHLGRALCYALNQRTWLENYLLDGRLEIDNNRAERSIKPFVIGRKNWLFCNTQEGAKVSAVLYSIIETAKENNIDPFRYLVYVFRHAPNLDLSDPATINQLLPLRASMTARNGERWVER